MSGNRKLGSRCGGFGIVVALIILCASAQAIPGYHIIDDVTANRAVHDFADDSFKFRAAVYQAQLDKNLWRLTLAAHKYLQQNPNRPERECSFATAYWAFQAIRTRESVPDDKSKELQALYNEAAKDVKEAAQRLPKSVTAHIIYGQYIVWHEMGDQKIKPMLAEFLAAVKLRPDLGDTHYWLATGYMSTGDNISKLNCHNIIVEFKTAISLDPRLTESNYFLSCAYSWPSVHDYATSQHYLDLYLKANPDKVNEPRVANLVKYLRQHHSP